MAKYLKINGKVCLDTLRSMSRPFFQVVYQVSPLCFSTDPIYYPTIWVKTKISGWNQPLIFVWSRDYWTRTSDLAPPRRVRYQLRQIPNIAGAKVRTIFQLCKLFAYYFAKKNILSKINISIKAFSGLIPYLCRSAANALLQLMKAVG